MIYKILIRKREKSSRIEIYLPDFGTGNLKLKNPSKNSNKDLESPREYSTLAIESGAEQTETFVEPAAPTEANVSGHLKSDMTRPNKLDEITGERWNSVLIRIKLMFLNISYFLKRKIID